MGSDFNCYMIAAVRSVILWLFALAQIRRDCEILIPMRIYNVSALYVCTFSGSQFVCQNSIFSLAQNWEFKTKTVAVVWMRHLTTLLLKNKYGGALSLGCSQSPRSFRGGCVDHCIQLILKQIYRLDSEVVKPSRTLDQTQLSLKNKEQISRKVWLSFYCVPKRWSYCGVLFCILL